MKLTKRENVDVSVVMLIKGKKLNDIWRRTKPIQLLSGHVR